jgi:hypothetical protein
MATATKSRARRTGSDLLDQLQELSDPRLPGVSVRFEEITPELATKYRALVPERQRALSEESSDQYSGDMAGLDWEFDGNTIVFNALGELVNGQHRMKAIEDSGVIRRGRFVKNTAPPSIVHFAWLLLRRIDLDSAESFFHELSEGPASNDHAYPIRRLQLKLQTKPAPGDEGIPDWVWLHYFCQAWNAWLDGRSVGNLRRPSPVRYDTVAKPLDILADDRPAGWEPL